MNKRRRERIERNKLDKTWSIAVRNRDGNKCVICRSQNQESNPNAKLVAHHLIPREIKFFRHNLDNGITLCPKHHKYSYDISAHKNPMVFLIWLQSNRKEQYLKLIS